MALENGFQEKQEIASNGDWRYIEDFRPEFLVGSVKTVGTGLTLHKSPMIVLMDPCYSHEDEEQVKKRINRIGQIALVTHSYRLLHKDVITEKMITLRQTKRSRFMERCLQDLTKASVRDIINVE